MSGLIQDPYLSCNNLNPTAYVDVFVDDFWGLDHVPAHRQCHIRRTLLHAQDKVFQPLYPADTAN